MKDITTTTKRTSASKLTTMLNTQLKEEQDEALSEEFQNIINTKVKLASDKERILHSKKIEKALTQITKINKQQLKHQQIQSELLYHILKVWGKNNSGYTKRTLREWWSQIEFANKTD